MDLGVFASLSQMLHLPQVHLKKTYTELKTDFIQAYTCMSKLWAVLEKDLTSFSKPVPAKFAEKKNQEKIINVCMVRMTSDLRFIPCSGNEK